MELGKIGIWTFQLELQPASRVAEIAAAIEEMGYGALWFPEAFGREAFTQAALLLAATKKMAVASGIANIWGRDAITAAAGQLTLDEAFGGRFLLGLGVSHAPMVETVRGHLYRKPLTAMREYLEAMDKAPYVSPRPGEQPKRCIGALAPKMLRLAAEKTLGAHPYFVPPEHTAAAREAMGKGPLLAPEQAVVLETDPAKAREVAREHMKMYLQLPNYRNNLMRLGYTEADLSDGGSDRLVDAIVSWGDLDSVVARVKAHHDAGADHVCLQVLTADAKVPALPEWKRLAEALL